jgi:3-isopropylmalate/(R)-2-methylmalate dehydratase large subunit
MAGTTLFENIWRSHMVRSFGERALIHIDRHFAHEGTSRNAFDGLRERKRGVKSLALNFGVIDHDPSTRPGRTAMTYEPSRERIGAMQENCREFGLRLFDVNDTDQGIVHVIATEQGIVLPGMTVVCGDSHTATNGGVGAWGWGIGTTEVERVFATQTLLVPKPKTMRANFLGRIADGVTAKDVILYLIGQHGVAIGTGYAVEYAGPAIRAIPVDGRLTICNMSIEFGARSGMIAPDDTTMQFFAGRRYAPKGALWDQAIAHWRTLPTAPDAVFDREIEIDCDKIKPQITWGTSPQEVIGVDEQIPDPSEVAAERRAPMAQALSYMGLAPGMKMEGLPIDVAFIGSCTNSRLSDLKAAAAVIKGRKVPETVTALVVPGSSQVKAAAEAAGLDRIFRDAGFQWRESGCSICQTLGGDFVPSGRRCISTSNRNFEDRQGPKSRTHLASPAMVAAAAVHGRIVDVRRV